MIEQKDQTEGFTEWLNYSPFLYNYLSIHQLPNYNGINNVRWAMLHAKNSSIKFISRNIYTSGFTSNNRGIFTISQIILPMTAKDLDDKRCTPSLKQIAEIQLNSEVRRIEQFLSPSHQKSLLALVTYQKDIYIYQSANIKQGDIIKLRGHNNNVDCIKANKQYLASGDEDAYILLWDIQKLQNTPYRSFKQHKGAVGDICWMPKNSAYSFLSGSADNSVILWDMRSKEQAHKIQAHTSKVNSLCEISEYMFLSGGADQLIKFWDLRKFKSFVYKDHQGGINCLKKLKASQERNNKNQNINISFMSASDDSKVIIWNDKVQFVHHGHQTGVQDIDFEFQNQLFISADGKANKIMVWKPSY